eukprot:TRINITY_DN8506_c0_g2_i1.p1 TRINITY_DN8506_c0_g2~~TRINITY_DN8506_c0_g2_i1.p1  ORF type:complete len:260 (+),score=32.66 TRINITY_DN8506_c0_g2_i1:3-782(+)
MNQDINNRQDHSTYFFFFQAEDGIRDHAQSRGLGDVYKRQVSTQSTWDDTLYWTENGTRYGLKGSPPQGGKNISELHSIASSLTYAKCSLMDIWTLDIISYLMMIEFATLDFQSLMKGQCNLTDVSQLDNNGICDSVVATSGSVTNNTDGLNSFIYRGIENPYGSFNVILDGIYTNGQDVSYCENPSYYGDTITSDYTMSSIKIPSADGYISKITSEPMLPAFKVTSVLGGSSTTYYSDYFTSGAGIRVLTYGGPCTLR